MKFHMLGVVLSFALAGKAFATDGAFGPEPGPNYSATSGFSGAAEIEQPREDARERLWSVENVTVTTGFAVLILRDLKSHYRNWELRQKLVANPWSGMGPISERQFERVWYMKLVIKHRWAAYSVETALWGGTAWGSWKLRRSDRWYVRTIGYAGPIVLGYLHVRVVQRNQEITREWEDKLRSLPQSP